MSVWSEFFYGPIAPMDGVFNERVPCGIYINMERIDSCLGRWVVGLSDKNKQGHYVGSTSNSRHTKGEREESNVGFYVEDESCPFDLYCCALPGKTIIHGDELLCDGPQFHSIVQNDIVYPSSSSSSSSTSSSSSSSSIPSAKNKEKKKINKSTHSSSCPHDRRKNEKKLGINKKRKKNIKGHVPRKRKKEKKEQVDGGNEGTK